MECVKIRFGPGTEPLAARDALRRAVRSVNRSGRWRTLYLDFFAFVDGGELPESAENAPLPEAQTEAVALPESPFFGVLLSTEFDKELLRELSARTENQNLKMWFAPLALDDAEETYREAAETCRGEEAALAELSAACGHLSLLLSDAGRAREAETFCREALDGYRKLSDKEAIAETCYHLARILYGGGRMDEAEKLYCEAMDIYRELSKRNADYHAPLARTCEDLAACLEERGRPEAAEWFRRNALDLYRKLSERNPAAYAPYVAASCGNLAGLLKASGRVAEAAGLYRIALDTYTKLAREDPARWEPALGFLYENLAAFEFTRSPASGKALLRSAWMLYQKYPDLSSEAERVRVQLREL